MTTNTLNDDGDFSVLNPISYSQGKGNGSRISSFRNSGGNPPMKPARFKHPERYQALESSNPRLQLQAALRQIDTLLRENAQLKNSQSDRAPLIAREFVLLVTADSKP